MYKERQRPILRGGDTYHVLPYPDGANYDGMQYYNTKLHQGSLVLFKPAASAPDDTTVLLKGLERDVVVLATVDANLDDEKFYVAASRAISRLIVIGPPELLERLGLGG